MPGGEVEGGEGIALPLLPGIEGEGMPALWLPGIEGEGTPALEPGLPGMLLLEPLRPELVLLVLELAPPLAGGCGVEGLLIVVLHAGSTASSSAGSSTRVRRRGVFITNTCNGM